MKMAKDGTTREKKEEISFTKWKKNRYTNILRKIPKLSQFENEEKKKCCFWLKTSTEDFVTLK